MALNLFWIFFKVGMFCFGGGNAMIGVFESLLVSEYSYIDTGQFADMVAISQITPGPVAINLATYTGAKLGDNFIESIFYSFMATFGMSLPSFIFIVLIAKFFKEFGESGVVKKVMSGIKPAVIGLIAGSVLLLCRFSIYDEAVLYSGDMFGAINFGALAIAVISFIAARKTRINPVIVLFAGGFVGIAIF